MLGLLGKEVFAKAYGKLSEEADGEAATLDTFYDLASVSKLLVGTAFMRLVEQGRVGLDAPVCSVLAEFAGERPLQAGPDPLQPGRVLPVPLPPAAAALTHADAGRVTFRQLLSHSSGV